MPTYGYQVSGEYAMIKGAGEGGLVDSDRVMDEALLAFKRAGADGILTYAALDTARKMAAG
jgi:porphobilinogen synthase